MTNVLFVCVQNAGRSQMAQALFERYAPPTDHARSAGTDAAERVHPEVIEVMGEFGIDISDRHPQVLTRELLEQADVVVTLGCGDELQYIPGKHYIDWQIAEPAGRPIDEVRAIRDDIATRVKRLVDELSSQLADLPLRQAFGLLDEGVLVIDSAGVVVSANPAACALLGRSERELLTPTFLLELDARTKEGLDMTRQRSVGMQVIATGNPARDVIVSVAKRDGSRVWLSLNYQPLTSAAGEVDGVVVSFRGHTTSVRRDPLPSPTRTRAAAPALTTREQEVISLLELGYGGREIANELHISAETVRTHISHAMAKVGAHSRTQLVALVRSDERASHLTGDEQ